MHEHIHIYNNAHAYIFPGTHFKSASMDSGFFSPRQASNRQERIEPSSSRLGAPPGLTRTAPFSRGEFSFLSTSPNQTCMHVCMHVCFHGLLYRAVLHRAVACIYIQYIYAYIHDQGHYRTNQTGGIVLWVWQVVVQG
jgi:hypothetical protein